MLPRQFTEFHEPTTLAFLISGKSSSSSHAGLLHGTAQLLGIYAYGGDRNLGSRREMLRELILGLQNVLNIPTIYKGILLAC
jgi:hypothetical protein